MRLLYRILDAIYRVEVVDSVRGDVVVRPDGQISLSDELLRAENEKEARKNWVKTEVNDTATALEEGTLIGVRGVSFSGRRERVYIFGRLFLDHYVRERTKIGLDGRGRTHDFDE